MELCLIGETGGRHVGSTHIVSMVITWTVGAEGEGAQRRQGVGGKSWGWMGDVMHPAIFL